MSRASELAARINAGKGHASDGIFRAAGAVAKICAWPNAEPRLSFSRLAGYSLPTLTADEALALARWILDTFGEPGA